MDGRPPPNTRVNEGPSPSTVARHERRQKAAAAVKNEIQSLKEQLLHMQRQAAHSCSNAYQSGFRAGVSAMSLHMDERPTPHVTVAVPTQTVSTVEVGTQTGLAIFRVLARKDRTIEILNNHTEQLKQIVKKGEDELQVLTSQLAGQQRNPTYRDLTPAGDHYVWEDLHLSFQAGVREGLEASQERLAPYTYGTVPGQTTPTVEAGTQTGLAIFRAINFKGRLKGGLEASKKWQ